MQLQQKLGLATFLCLQILMIVIAVIRISGFIYHDAFDEGWVYLWQQIEACISVSTISLTAFRTMFVANASRRQPSPWQRSWNSSWRKRFKKSSEVSTGEEGGELDDLTIPSATLSGMRTMIGGERTQRGDGTMFSVMDESEMDWPPRPLPARAPPQRPRRDGPSERPSLGRLRSNESKRASWGRMAINKFDDRRASLSRPGYESLNDNV